MRAISPSDATATNRGRASPTSVVIWQCHPLCHLCRSLLQQANEPRDGRPPRHGYGNNSMESARHGHVLDISGTEIVRVKKVEQVCERVVREGP